MRKEDELNQQPLIVWNSESIVMVLHSPSQVAQHFPGIVHGCAQSGGIHRILSHSTRPS